METLLFKNKLPTFNDKIQIMYNHESPHVDLLMDYVANYGITLNPLCITCSMEYMVKYYDKRYTRFYLMNSNITREFIYEHWDDFKTIENMYYMTQYHVLTVPEWLTLFDNNDRIWRILVINMSEEDMETYYEHIQPYIHLNKTASYEFVDKHIDWKWNWEHIYRKAPEWFVLKHMDSIIEYGSIISDSVSYEFIDAHNHHHIFDWIDISMKAPLWFLEKHKSKVWFCCVSSNKNITLEFIGKHITERWDTVKLYNNIGVFPIEFVDTYLNSNDSYKLWPYNLPLEWYIKYNKDIPDRYSRQYYELWRHNTVEWHDMICMECQLDEIENMCGRYLSHNPNLTSTFIEQHMDLDWDYAVLSKHPALSVHTVMKYDDKPWIYTSICQYNPCLTIEWIDKYKNVHMEYLTMNMTLTPPIYEKYKFPISTLLKYSGLNVYKFENAMIMADSYMTL
jgi:hypothetical protein